MNKQQEVKLNMYYTVQRALAEAEPQWTGIPAFNAAVAELNTNLEAIQGTVEKQVIDITGFARDKQQSLEQLIAVTLVVSRSTLAYATVQGDLVLAGKMRVGNVLLRRHNDAVVARHCQAVLDAVTAVAPALVDFGVTAQRLADLKQAIARFGNALSAPRVAITTRKGATAELNLLMKDTTKLLAKRIDGMMEQFRSSAPTFFRAYMDARIIVDRGVRSTADPSLRTLGIGNGAAQKAA